MTAYAGIRLLDYVTGECLSKKIQSKQPREDLEKAVTFTPAWDSCFMISFCCKMFRSKLNSRYSKLQLHMRCFSVLMVLWK